MHVHVAWRILLTALTKNHATSRDKASRKLELRHRLWGLDQSGDHAPDVTSCHTLISSRKGHRVRKNSRTGVIRVTKLLAVCINGYQHEDWCSVKHLLPTKSRRGRIVNISSVVGQMGNAGQANYCASQAGLIGLTKAAALELGSRGVTVNAIAPGFIETDMTETLPQEVRDKYLERIPLGRLGSAQAIADAVAYLASDQAEYITGQVLGINGGMYL